MTVTNGYIAQAAECMNAERDHAHATSARCDRRTRRIIICLHPALEFAFPPYLVESLAEATPETLSDIEASSFGLGLHWPQIDAISIYRPY